MVQPGKETSVMQETAPLHQHIAQLLGMKQVEERKGRQKKMMKTFPQNKRSTRKMNGGQQIMHEKEYE